MKSVTFPEANFELAKDQLEYQTLHGYLERKAVTGARGIIHPNVPWSFTAVFELSDEEIEAIVRTKKLWFRQMLFGHSFQPIFMSTLKEEVLPEIETPEKQS